MDKIEVPRVMGKILLFWRSSKISVEMKKLLEKYQREIEIRVGIDSALEDQLVQDQSDLDFLKQNLKRPKFQQFLEFFNYVRKKRS